MITSLLSTEPLMKCAIVFTGTYGSTEQYAQWISEKTGFPVFDIKSSALNLADFDSLIIGTPIYYYRPVIARWIQRNLTKLLTKRIILYTVSGAPGGSKLNGWLEESLPSEFLANAQHFALQGRMDLARLGLFHRMMIKIGSLRSSNGEASAEEWNGFDYMDRNSIAPIVEATQLLHSAGQDSPQDHLAA
ncbi:MAG: flavodoxin domain-containing protein [Pseudomonadales bacterium]|nr:flavodoxin domain-containing protein [Pseudomonadales bacterium]